MRKFARGGASSWMGIPPFGTGWHGAVKMQMPSVRPRGFKHLQGGGFIDSTVPGRTDKHPVTVESGSYVLPADYVSSLGQNNSAAGYEKIKKKYGPGTEFGPRLRLPAFAGGGSVEPVPIIVAGGEVILPPNIVRRIGGGSLEKGHAKLDKEILEERKKHIKRLRGLKPPKGSGSERADGGRIVNPYRIQPSSGLEWMGRR